MYAYLILEHIYTSNINISLPSKLMQWFCNLCCHIHLPDGMLSKMSQPRSINKYSYEVCHIFFSSLCNEWNSFLTSRVLLVMGNDNKQTQTGYKVRLWLVPSIHLQLLLAYTLENSFSISQYVPWNCRKTGIYNFLSIVWIEISYFDNE